MSCLDHWCDVVTQDYAAVKYGVMNKHDFWRSGLGFCAIIARYRPDLLQFDCLDPSDWIENTRLMFSVAETHLNIKTPDYLDPETMADNDIELLMEFAKIFYDKFSDKNPLPTTRTKGKENSETSGDQGLGDSLSSSFASSELSLSFSSSHGSINEKDNSHNYLFISTEENDKPKFNSGHYRSYESLVDTGVNSLKLESKKNSESFTKALLKFSSLSNSNICIKLPLSSSDASSKKITNKNIDSRGIVNMQTQTEMKHHREISTQTESSDDQAQENSSDCCCHKWNAKFLWNSNENYYSTLYSNGFQMYSTLV